MSNLLNKMRSRSNNLRKMLSPAKLLLFFFLISLLQYAQTGNVTWVTDTFRWFGGETIEQTTRAYDLTGRVMRVADGDTLTILDAKQKQHKVRLFGIDSPESEQPYYKAARKALSRLTSGKDVAVTIKDTDRYGRTVGVIYLDNTDINLEMVKLGYAWWYQQYAKDNQALKQAEQFARSRKLGLWGDPAPMAPWDWRRSQRKK
ncbi:MAG: endonuclease YncB(thermonuclease family) [Halioglobus sp.]|jgi:endonuclease YncB( thermonuclease family)